MLLNPGGGGLFNSMSFEGGLIEAKGGGEGLIKN